MLLTDLSINFTYIKSDIATEATNIILCSYTLHTVHNKY